MNEASFEQRLSKLARALIHRTHGQDLVEYAMLAGIASAIVVLALDEIGTRTVNYYGATVTSIAERTAAAGTMPVGGDPGDGGGAGAGNGGGSGNGGGGTGDTGGGTGDTGGGTGDTGGNGNGNGGGGNGGGGTGGNGNGGGGKTK